MRFFIRFPNLFFFPKAAVFSKSREVYVFPEKVSLSNWLRFQFLTYNDLHCTTFFESRQESSSSLIINFAIASKSEEKLRSWL
ncbi:hypothetical protein BWD12_05360 [Leptospira santarosai serovar Bananal]|uniref:Uncharacterized protein n=1 Tax=Leptospira santarosai TaxID=28183 RepID=A0AB73NFX4_9LEPT|nr:hypothetical protein B2G51_11000 [Leptospira santarosai]OLY61870.1 hypothetical protein BV917_03075 [Leptospira santarosai serovar Guaricura]OLY65933.1 hypothetical protein BWD11_01175 [Leptospira santarosai serovar Grippotyphosa]ONF80362.1 hypothetical protein BWD12_05360 [Leptospira santarosai serovar Bananal]ONF85583.1 hypothetical protein BWD13_13485 [Leptospira santarosai serovar Grippotyphosa]